MPRGLTSFLDESFGFCASVSQEVASSADEKNTSNQEIQHAAYSLDDSQMRTNYMAHL